MIQHSEQNSEQHKENLKTFKKIKDIHQVLDSLGELIATNLYLSVKQGYEEPAQEHARLMASTHVGQAMTFLRSCVEAAQQGKTEELLEIIEEWKA